MGAGRRVIILFFIIIAYLFIGAAIFSSIESANENRIRTNLWKHLDQFVERNPCINATELKDILMEVWHAASIGVDTTLRNDNHTALLAHWNFANAFFFSTTVITTIGYGHHAPATTLGQNFCILYGLVGIPLMAVLLSEVSSKWKRNLREAGGYLNSHLHNYITNDKVRKVAIVSIFVIIAYVLVIFLPAIAFSYLEGWDFSTAHYYCFISLSTIGFGDYVASQSTGNVVWMWIYKVGTCLYLIGGLGIWAIVFHGVQTKKKHPHYGVGKTLKMLRRRTHPWLQIMHDEAEKMEKFDNLDMAVVASVVAAASVAGGVDEENESQEGSHLATASNIDSDDGLYDLQDDDESPNNIRQPDEPAFDRRQRLLSQVSVDFLDPADEEETPFKFQSLIADHYATVSPESVECNDLSSPIREHPKQPSVKPYRSSSLLWNFPRNFGASKKQTASAAAGPNGQVISLRAPSRPSSTLLRGLPPSIGASDKTTNDAARTEKANLKSKPSLLLERKSHLPQETASTESSPKKLGSASNSLNREDSGIHGGFSQSTLDMESSV